MRKILLILILLAGSATVSKAQFNGGLRLGLNACQIDGDHMGGYNLAGIVGGLFVSYPFKNNWEGQFEMLFSQKGSARLIDSIVQPGPWNVFRINYIEVPVMVNYRLSPKIKLSAGLGGALMIGNHFEGLVNNIYENYDIVTKGELSGLIGAQYYFTPRFSVYGRWTYSLIGINKPNPALSALVNAAGFYLWDGGMANNVISFGLYYSFLKQKTGK